MSYEIGILAGKIWNYLNLNGEVNSLKLKLDLEINRIQLFLALGWLLKEDKINLEKKNEEYFISLKQ